MQVLVVLSAVLAGVFLIWAIAFLRKPQPAARWLGLFAAGISLNALSDSLTTSMVPMASLGFWALVTSGVIGVVMAVFGFWFHLKCRTGQPVTRQHILWMVGLVIFLGIDAPETLDPALLDALAHSQPGDLNQERIGYIPPLWVEWVALGQMVLLQGLTAWLLWRSHRLLPALALPDLDRRRLAWLVGSLWVAFAVWVLRLPTAIFYWDQPEVAVGAQIFSLLGAGVALARYSIHYYMSLSPGMPPADAAIQAATPDPAPKYDRSPLTPAAAQALAERLQAYLDTSQAYRQPGLSLDDLATALGVTPHALSQAMNQHLQLNFYELVNQYRVQAACQQLADPAQRELSLLAIAFEAGFQSKSTFNSAFKKHVGVTPSTYREHALAGKPLPQALH